jgi:hypothetical protein
MSRQNGGKSRETDDQVPGASPTGRGPSTNPPSSGQDSGRWIARALGAVLKSLPTVILIVLLAVQVVELGLLLDLYRNSGRRFLPWNHCWHGKKQPPYLTLRLLHCHPSPKGSRRLSA